MALLAQPKRKEKYGFDPRNTNWASDDSKFGQKLMEKMGWEKGKGLGANEDGIVDHIKASYKSDTRGLGCSPKDADAWIAHQDDFNDLLRVLNEDSSREPEKVNSSIEDRQEGKKRFNGRFARGRVQTLRSTEDLDCIMGRRKTSEPSTPVTQSATNSDDEQNDTDLKTVTSSYSVQEYFAKKMKELKSRRAASQAADEESKNTPTISLKVSAEGDNCTKSVVESPGISTDMSKEKGWYDVSDWAATDKQDEKRKKKKYETGGTGDPGACGNGNSLKTAKRKKRKLKSDTITCGEFEVSIDENSSHLESKDNENGVDLVNRLPDSEGSVNRKRRKSKKRKEKDGSKSIEEDGSEEVNKRKRRKPKLEHSVIDEREISSSLESKMEGTEAENVTSLSECEKSLKTKRGRSRRKELEMSDDTSQCDNQKAEGSHNFSVSEENEDTKGRNKRKRRKVEGECLGNDSCLEDAESEKKSKKKKKKRKEEKETENVLDCSDLKERKQVEKETDITDKTSKAKLAYKSSRRVTENILPALEHVEEQTEMPESKKKKKTKVEMTDSVRQSDTNGAQKPEINHHINDDKLPEKGKDIESRQDLDASRGTLKKKRKEKKKKRQLKKDLSDSFPGSNFGELGGYEPYQ